ncbi:Gfo/Idh/MocA family oxidoreductase [Coraliomargarita sp. SDUM461004]|uniref:Gfo/Idh/MocA family oxidoreductase n=1 Tax=Thalassobacterium sedimentorum TaxID=3041258 RepID=A0ABU1ALY3_9BACT|nr:Gfo/Idh/MocA family oxidoreductase [Coraliomargarita sp. SDUM461004]MDQ8195749.1 Gfo/Idh/MocA family oxidoreductase [Coraliomargarita sp. SDUM461004]
MKSQKLRIGFIGAGANTRKMHIPGFHKLENVELSMVANRSVESAQEVAKKVGIQRVAKDWREVVEDPSIDAVCIGTWPNMHAEVTIAALENDKHVLCEARMACNLAEARAMQAAAQAHPELVAQIVPAPFSLDFDATIREMIRSGKLGDLLEVRVVHTAGQAASPDAPMTWRQDVELSGQNILTMGIMHETVQRWVQDEPSWLLADGAIFQDQRQYPGSKQVKEVKVPDSLSVLGRFANTGARMIYHFSGVESGESRMEFRLNGSKGGLRFDVVQTALLFAKAGEVEEKKITLSRAESRGWQVEADFVRSIREGAPVQLTSFEQGLRYMTFTEMVAQSLAADSQRVNWIQ